MIRKTFFTKVTCCLLVLSVVLGIISCKKAVSGKDSSSGVMPGIFSDTLFQHKVVFQTQWLHQAQFAGFYVAYEKGLYKDYGIDVTIEMGGPENPSAEALVNKKADIVSMFLTTALREVDEGNRLVNLAQIGQKSSMLLVSKKSSGIQKVDDMNHKRVGLWKNDFMEPSLIFLRKYNINCQIVPVSWTTNVLAEDVVDAIRL
jgi:NitT/TauT family transport system substrate-binding protein